MALLSLAGAVRAQPAAPSSAVPIVLTLEPSAPLEEGASKWLSRLSRALESSQPTEGAALEVRDALVLEPRPLVEGGARLGERYFRQQAQHTGAHFVVVARVARLTQHYSLDVRVLAVPRMQELAHFIYQGEGAAGLSAAISEAATAVRSILARQPSRLRAERGVWARHDFAPDVEGLTPQTTNTVVGVQVLGNRRIEADAIRAVVGTRVGEPLRQDRIGEDVRRIYALGFFRDVQVEVLDEHGGKLVTFLVEENPIIRRVSVSGNENMGSDDIKDQLTLTVGSTTDYPLLLENQARVKALYKSQGYYLVEVSYHVEPIGEGSVEINFDIREGKKLRLIAIDFEGNEALSDKELLRVVQTKPWGRMSFVTKFWDRSGIYAEPIFYQDLDRIGREYMDEGFIRATIGEPQVDYDEKGLRVKVKVSEGPRYYVGHVDVVGDSSMDSEVLLEFLELEQGQVFRRSTLTGDVQRLQAHYADRGFFSAKVGPHTRVDEEKRTVDCSFEVDKGELYFVDRIEVHGNTRTRDEVIRRELGLAEGELYSARVLQRSRARIRRLGFFEEVGLEAKPLDEPHRVAVHVDVVERPTGTFSFGAGVGSTDGFLLNTSLRQDNLFGRGWGLAATLDFGSDNSRMYLRFSDPYFRGSLVSLSATFGRNKTEFIDFKQETTGFSMNLSYPLDEGETRVGTGYAYSAQDVSGLGEFQAASMLQREEFGADSTTSMGTISWVNDTRDDIRMPREGQISGFAAEFAGLGGLNTFVRLEGRTTWFMPAKRWLGFDSTFVVNSRAGWAIPLNDISDFDLPECTSAACLEALNDFGGDFLD
ncbi:MAG: outer membrane protein assembly factor BamA, partial [Myxococcales bacterium]|nr:outer membrane protein assembly factor BamA [Myxococcales bacterium]